MLIYVVVRLVEALTFFLWKVFFVVVLTFNCVSFNCHIISYMVERGDEAQLLREAMARESSQVPTSIEDTGCLF